MQDSPRRRIVERWAITIAVVGGVMLLLAFVFPVVGLPTDWLRGIALAGALLLASGVVTFLYSADAYTYGDRTPVRIGVIVTNTAWAWLVGVALLQAASWVSVNGQGYEWLAVALALILQLAGSVSILLAVLLTIILVPSALISLVSVVAAIGTHPRRRASRGHRPYRGPAPTPG